MKKLFILLLMILFSGEIVFAANIEVLPAIQSKTNIQDKVWAGSFQAVWNDIADRFDYGPIRFADGLTDDVRQLNLRTFDSYDIPRKSYLKFFKKNTPQAKSKLLRVLRRKYNINSDFVSQLQPSSKNKNYILYSLFSKDIKFIRKFDSLGISNFRNSTAEFYGVNSNSDNSLYDGIRVLFYNDDEDYAVAIKTSGRDEVFLYKTPTTKSFNFIYSDMVKKSQAYREENGNVQFTYADELMIPYIQFYEEKQFDDLVDRRIKGTTVSIDGAAQTVRFSMKNNSLAKKVKSKKNKKTDITNSDTAAVNNVTQNRQFFFNDTFVLFVKDQERLTPYFALRVYDIDKFRQ